MSSYNSTITFKCDENSDKLHIGYLSQLCTNGSYNEGVCIAHLDEDIYGRTALGVWGMIVVLLGVIGNLSTLIAIPYAWKRKR